MPYIDIRTLDQNHFAETFDLCIVGAGAAGISIAQALRHTNLKICLLESGGFDPDGETQLLYTGENTGLDYSLEATRIRHFGGTTNIWSGWCAQLNKQDFKSRDWVAHSGWPIQKDDLRPYYARAANVLNVKNEFDVAKEEPEKVKAISSPFQPCIWRIAAQKNATHGLNLGKKYWRVLEKAPNLSVYLYANLHDIRLNDQLSHVKTIDVKTLQGRHFTVKARHYILACGGIANARLLLNASSQMKNGLGNDRDLVGRFFQEHLHIYDYISIFHPESNHPLIQYGVTEYVTLYKTKKYNCGIRLTDDEQRIHQTLSASFDLFQGSILGNNWKMEDIKSDLDVLQKLTGCEGALTKFINPIARLEQSPHPSSRVTLSREKDALGLHQSSLHWAVQEQDFKGLLHGIKKLAALFGEKGLGVVHYNDKQLLETGRPEKIYGGSHHMGTTRMHDDPGQGVVTKDCRVHGIDNLYIAGSSVFPTSGWANPTFTIVALALRLADHVKEKLA